MKIHYDIKVTGKVQGVFFRANAQSKAEQLGITGWVRNEPDGTVSIAAEGKKDDLHKLIDWCKEGPDWANVNYVDYEEGEIENYESFRITY